MDVVNGVLDVACICASILQLWEEKSGDELVMVGVQKWGLRPSEHLFFTQ